MRLYYGSKTEFKQPIFGEGNLTNDYGLGFYLTKSYELAKLWASKNENGGYVLTFDFNEEDLEILNLGDDKEEDVLRWLSILVNHRFDTGLKEKYIQTIEWLDRKFHVNLDFIDIVVGYRADDAYFNYSFAFVANELSFEILTEAMRIGNLGLQYVAISKKAFKRFRFIKSERVDHTDEYEDFRKKALFEFNKLKKSDNVNNTFIRDLMRKHGN